MVQLPQLEGAILEKLGEHWNARCGALPTGSSSLELSCEELECLLEILGCPMLEALHPAQAFLDALISQLSHVGSDPAEIKKVIAEFGLVQSHHGPLLPIQIEKLHEVYISLLTASGPVQIPLVNLRLGKGEVLPANWRVDGDVARRSEAGPLEEAEARAVITALAGTTRRAVNNWFKDYPSAHELRLNVERGFSYIPKSRKTNSRK